MMKAFPIFAMAVFLPVAAAAATYQFHGASMLSPPAQMDKLERKLDASEIDKIQCMDSIRRNIAKRPGIILGSEKISFSKDFGYVFRYNLSSFDSESGISYEITSILVIWTNGSEKYRFATYPGVKLREIASKKGI